MKLINLFLKPSKNKFSFLLMAGLAFFSFSGFAQKTKIKNKKLYNLECLFIGGQKNTICKDRATLMFNAKDKTARCNFFCNYFDYNYFIQNNDIKFSSMIPGPIPCSDVLLGLESDIKEDFPKVNRYEILNKKIYFFDKKDTVMVFYEQ